MSDPSVNVLDEAAALVAKTLDVAYCKVLELLPDGKALLLRSGVGWREGLVGRATVPTGADSQAGFTLRADKPIVVENVRAERRFSAPPLLREHNVLSGMSVVISGKPDGQPCTSTMASGSGPVPRWCTKWRSIPSTAAMKWGSPLRAASTARQS